MSLRRTIAANMPPGLVRRAGRWQFRYPALAPLIRWAVRSVRTGESTIQHGIAKGLRFDPAGGNPGYALGTTDPLEQRVLAESLKRDHVFYDIGANVGFYAVAGANLVGTGGYVYAFEPFAASAAATRRNAERNGFQNVQVIECAVSNVCGAGTFLLRGGSVEFKLIDPLASTSADEKTIRVPVISVDEFLASGAGRSPNVVMIDVEGAEINVIEGMRKTIAKHRPIILCEVHWLGKPFADLCRRLANENAYEVTQVLGPSNSRRAYPLACVDEAERANRSGSMTSFEVEPITKIRPSSGWAALDLSGVWTFRDLLLALASRDVKLRYKQTALGVAWVVLQPLLAAGVFSFVFGRVAQLPSDGIPYFLFSYAGLLGWNLFNTTVTKTSGCLVGNSQLISKIFFPRLVLPLSVVPSALIDFAVALAMMTVLMFLYRVHPTAALAAFPLWMAIILLLAVGLGLITAALAVSYRDIQYILPVLTQILLYASPVAYSLSYALTRIAKNRRVFYLLNPLTAPLEGFAPACLARRSRPRCLLSTPRP